MLRPIFWRHTAESVAKWLQLPAQTTETRLLAFQPTERHHYEACLQSARARVAPPLAQGLSNGLVAGQEFVLSGGMRVDHELTALRQLCCHPSVGASAVAGRVLHSSIFFTCILFCS
jgi:hypothetical protein